MKSPYFLYERYPALVCCKDDIEKAAQALNETFKNGGVIYCCGNGGSAADCEHIVGELMKGFLKKRTLSDEEKMRLSAYGEKGDYLACNLQGAIPAVSLVNSVGLGTAFANDVAPELVFAQQIYGLGKAHDALIAISTSGNSKNVIYAILSAKVIGQIYDTLGLYFMLFVNSCPFYVSEVIILLIQMILKVSGCCILLV